MEEALLSDTSEVKRITTSSSITLSVVLSTFVAACGSLSYGFAVSFKIIVNGEKNFRTVMIGKIRKEENLTSYRSFTFNCCISLLCKPKCFEFICGTCVFCKSYNNFCKLCSIWSCSIIISMFTNQGRIVNVFLLNLKKLRWTLL